MASRFRPNLGERVGQIRLGQAEMGVILQRLLVVIDGLRNSPLMEERESKIVVRLDRGGIDLKRLTVRVDGVGQAVRVSK